MRHVLPLALLLAACPSPNDTADTGPDGCEDPTPWYPDADLDGFGLDSGVVEACTTPGELYVDQGGDCDDQEQNAFPGAPESCLAGADLNCDGAVGCTLTPEDLWGFSDAPATGWFWPTSLGDVDGDDQIDVAVGAAQRDDNAGTVSQLAGPWSALRTVAETPSVDIAGQAGQRLGETLTAVDDLLGDGGMALVVLSAAESGKRVQVYATPLTEASAPVLSWTYPSTFAGQSMAAGDLDGDGVQELIISDGDGRVLGFEGPLTTAPETPTWSIDLAELQSVGKQLLVEDVDDDGTDDLIVLADRNVEAGFDDVLMLFNGPLSSTRTSADAALVLSGEGTTVRVWGAAAGDLDGDGDAELAVSWTGGGRRVTIIDDLSDGDATFGERAWSTLESEDVDYVGLTLGVVAGAAGGRALVGGAPQYTDDEHFKRGRVDVWVDPSAGTFAPEDAAVTILGSAEDHQIGSSPVTLGDLDGDGTPEIWFRAGSNADLGGIIIPGSL
jgi:hypothetical protein